MPVEQTITALPDSGPDPVKSGASSANPKRARKPAAKPEAEPAADEKPVQDVRDRLRAAFAERARFALTSGARAQRDQQFATAMKSVAKDLSVGSVAGIENRKIRQAVRVSLYGSLTHYAQDMTKEYLRLAERARRARMLASGAILVATLTVTGSIGWIFFIG